VRIIWTIYRGNDGILQMCVRTIVADPVESGPFLSDPDVWDQIRFRKYSKIDIQYITLVYVEKFYEYRYRYL
jgi:hypothetical protein